MENTINAAPEGALQSKAHLTGTVIKTTLAGAIVDIGQIVPGVVHISQLRAEPVNRVEDVVQAGQTVDVWVRRIRDDRIELTMIQPLALEWREIKPDMIVKGKVDRLESYGAFVDIGAERPGLVHVSEIAHGFIKTPGQVLHEGDEVETKVLEVNRRKKQIKLSIKAVLPEPEEKPVEKKVNKKGRSRKGKTEIEEGIIETEPREPDPTVMEMAWREALVRAENKTGKKEKPAKVSHAREQEDILNRTLEQRITTG